MCCTQAQLDDIAAQKPAYIILDEFHRAGAECWGESTVALLKLCPEAKLLGLTATNVRYLDNNRDMAEELFDGRVASDMTLGEAIVRGILPTPNYVTTVYQYQKDLARYQTRVDNLRSAGIQDVNQKYLDALRRALEQADGLDKVFAHHITNKSGKYIVFCANKEHMDEMISHVPEWFAKVNAEVAVYEAYSDDPGTDKAFADFKADESDRLKLLFCIDMLNEGVHVEGISGVILFRPTISPTIYKQQIGRALTAGENSTPLILDVVNNFEGLCSIAGLQGEIQEAVYRLNANGEGNKIITERLRSSSRCMTAGCCLSGCKQVCPLVGTIIFGSKHLLCGAWQPEYSKALYHTGGIEPWRMADDPAPCSCGTDSGELDRTANRTAGQHRDGVGQPQRCRMGTWSGRSEKISGTVWKFAGPGKIQNDRWLSSGKVDQQCAETPKRWKADGRTHSTTGSVGNDMERI